MLIDFAIWSTTGLLVIFALYVVVEFLREGSARAATISAISLIIPIGSWLSAAVLFPESRWLLLIIFYGSVVLLLVLLFFPTGKTRPYPSTANERIDERDIMFARARYKKGDPNYERYYGMHPELKMVDDFTRHLPNLGEPGSETFDPHNAAIADALFSWIERVRETVDGPVAETKQELTIREASERLKGLAKYLGAADAGTTAVRPDHVYSHIGRGTGEWGSELDPGDFTYALVFTVEMKHEMLNSAPMQPVLADSSRQYLEGAKIALVIAQYLRALGYEARAHIDGNYRLILPTLAVDAGLGEIGRHSLLITPKEGSRVRIGAVTTELPLVQAEQISFGVEDFCNTCKKCARNCPTRAIPSEEKEKARGTRYWKIHPVRCYRYWRGVGTDCGLCITVCPYSRPKGPLHSFVRTACSRSAVSRRIFARLDDLFYGRKPRSTRYPDWMKEGVSEEDKERIGIK